MRRVVRDEAHLVIARWIAGVLPVPVVLQARIDVLTNRYDSARTGANLHETRLTPDNVDVGQFGRLYAHPVDGAVYAQPLYVSGVTMSGSPRNVLTSGR